MALNCSLKLIKFQAKSLRQRRTCSGLSWQELQFGSPLGCGRRSGGAEWRIAEWFGELGRQKSAVAPIHITVAFPPAELSSSLGELRKR